MKMEYANCTNEYARFYSLILSLLYLLLDYRGFNGNDRKQCGNGKIAASTLLNNHRMDCESFPVFLLTPPLWNRLSETLIPLCSFVFFLSLSVRLQSNIKTINAIPKGSDLKWRVSERTWGKEKWRCLKSIFKSHALRKTWIRWIFEHFFFIFWLGLNGPNWN